MYVSHKISWKIDRFYSKEISRRLLVEILLRVRNWMREKDTRQQDERALEQHLEPNVDEHKTVSMGEDVTLAIR